MEIIHVSQKQSKKVHSYAGSPVIFQPFKIEDSFPDSKAFFSAASGSRKSTKKQNHQLPVNNA